MKDNEPKPVLHKDHTDEGLVKGALNSDHDNFDQLMQKYQAAVYGRTYQWTKNFADAQDLTQETFFQAYRKLNQLRDHAKFASWLRGIATNLCRMWKRSQKGSGQGIDNIDDRILINETEYFADQLQETLEAKEKRKAVLDVIDLLSDKVRLTARLFYVDGLSYQEIGDIQGVPVTTVESRLHKARHQIKKEVFGRQTEDEHEKLIARLRIIGKGVFKMDAIRVEVGTDLIPLVKPPERELTSYIKKMRVTTQNDLE